jgi:crotonobetainyl-CoA:carnitine CoA-transferase CaiB-like acyl-CoA transferase
MSLLAGIKVLEISDGLVDFGGRMLAELGAAVASVVNAEDRDHARDLAWHHGKTRVAADDREAILAIARGADIILDGQRNGDRFDLSSLLSERPELIHVRVNTLVGASRPSTDLTLMAESSLMAVTGDPDRAPLRFPGEQAYALTGIQAATAALMGLYARRRIGRGQSIDVSALQSVTLASYREAIMYEWTKRVGRRNGNLLVRGKSGVRQVWPVKDGHVTWSMIDNPPMMRAVVATMAEQGEAGELADIDWDNTLVADLPQDTIDRWQRVVERFFATRGKAELGRLSLEKGWGLSVISTPQEVLASEQLAARGLFVEIEDEVSGQRTRLHGPLFQSSLRQEPPRRVLSKTIPAASFAGWE